MKIFCLVLFVLLSTVSVSAEEIHEKLESNGIAFEPDTVHAAREYVRQHFPGDNWSVKFYLMDGVLFMQNGAPLKRINTQILYVDVILGKVPFYGYTIFWGQTKKEAALKALGDCYQNYLILQKKSVPESSPKKKKKMTTAL